MSGGEAVYPYDTIVYVTDTIGGVDYQGSGVLIAPNLVLTASHVVYNSQYGAATNIVVTPGYDFGASPYGASSWRTIQYNTVQDAGGTIALADSQSDFAIIRLSTSFATAGYMGIESNYAGGLANVSGYPAIDAGAQITDSEYLTRNPSYTLYDGIALGAGSSGGPVWIYGTNGDPYVVGLVSSASDFGTGYFTEIATSVLDTIQAWETTDSLACFAAGTRIATRRGEVAVEHLRSDDAVVTRGDGQAPIAWIGHRHVACHRHIDPARVWPIRVARHAFGRGRPRRDLLLSPDHAVFIGGRLVPVRHLVNGATIVAQPAAGITYWHVELPQHGVLFAEGLAVESYLDTGNRACFDNGGPSVVLHPDFGERMWQTAACAKLLRDGARLVAIRRRLHAHALALGHTLTTRPDLKLRAGKCELAADVAARRWHVRVPPGCAQLRLVSRTWVPSHSRPGARDTRRLGVAIGRLWLDGREIGLDSPRLDRGWHAPEAHWRWTDGDAVVPLDGARSVTFEVAMTGSYWLPADARESRDRAA